MYSIYTLTAFMEADVLFSGISARCITARLDGTYGMHRSDDSVVNFVVGGILMILKES